MTNNGGKIIKANVWQVAIPAGAITMGATIQNTAINCGRQSEYDPNGVNCGPPLLIWPYATDPNNLDGNGKVAGLADGALLTLRPSDPVNFTPNQALAVYVCATRDGTTFACGYN